MIVSIDLASANDARQLLTSGAVVLGGLVLVLLARRLRRPLPD